MHKVAIPERVLQAALARRGKQHLAESLAAATTALVVVDMQNEFTVPGGPFEVPVARAIVPNINRLAAAQRAAGGRVIWLRMKLYSEDQHWNAMFRLMQADEMKRRIAGLKPGSEAFEIYSEMDVRPEDTILDKTRYSAFIGGASELDAVLRKAGIDTVIVTGTLTNVCCETTARDAMMLDYNVVFVADANAAASDELHNATLVNIIQTVGDVMTTDEVIARIRP